MTFHVVHLFEHGSYLYKKRGRLYCQFQGGRENSLPVENIRAVIVAARGITFSAQLLSALASANCLVLHCDDKFRPCAVTMPLSRIINQRILETQCSARGGFHQSCWKKVVAAKIENQATVLSMISNTKYPFEQIGSGLSFDEAQAARMYFNRYFKILGAHGQNRSNRHQGWANALLNYGYAVLSAFVHRSIVVHGLIPQLGLHHRPRYGTWPLVYDLMEPLRAVVDAHVWLFSRDYNPRSEDMLVAEFARFIGNRLKDFRISHKRYSVKLIDAVDFMVRSFATACESKDSEQLWVPKTELKHLLAIPSEKHGA